MLGGGPQLGGRTTTVGSETCGALSYSRTKHVNETAAGTAAGGDGGSSLPDPNAAHSEQTSSWSAPTCRWPAAIDASTANASRTMPAAIRCRGVAWVRRRNIDMAIKASSRARHFLGRAIHMITRFQYRAFAAALWHGAGAGDRVSISRVSHHRLRVSERQGASPPFGFWEASLDSDASTWTRCDRRDITVSRELGCFDGIEGLSRCCAMG